MEEAKETFTVARRFRVYSKKRVSILSRLAGNKLMGRVSKRNQPVLSMQPKS